MTFGDALGQLELGSKMTRTGWNGRGMYIYLANEEVKDGNRYLQHINMVDAQGDHVVGWLASQTDMLEKDWTICL